MFLLWTFEVTFPLQENYQGIVKFHLTLLAGQWIYHGWHTETLNIFSCKHGEQRSMGKRVTIPNGKLPELVFLCKQERKVFGKSPYIIVFLISSTDLHVMVGYNVYWVRLVIYSFFLLHVSSVIQVCCHKTIKIKMFRHQFCIAKFRYRNQGSW